MRGDGQRGQRGRSGLSSSSTGQHYGNSNKGDLRGRRVLKAEENERQRLEGREPLMLDSLVQEGLLHLVWGR